MTAEPKHPHPHRPLIEVITLFLKLGATAFGGPAAHIAMMHNEVVERRKWLTEEEFLDLLGATNLIPGPNSTEMAIHLSLKQAGWPGLVLGGVSFILPAMLIVGGLAGVYVEYGSLPQAARLLDGVKPVIVAVIFNALLLLGKTALKTRLLAVIGAASLALALLGVNPLAVLLAAAAAGLAVKVVQGKVLPPGSRGLAAMIILPAAGVDLRVLFLTFLKIGSVLYGSGYVLLAFLRADFVTHLGWLTDQQLLDAVAVGQITPGPVFTTATFIGYLLAGVPGALLATLGIFLPSFVFVALSSRWIPRMRESAWVAAVLDGVNAASLGLMAAVTWELGRASLTGLIPTLTVLAAYILLVRYKVNTTWLILGGAIVGVVSTYLAA